MTKLDEVEGVFSTDARSAVLELLAKAANQSEVNNGLDSEWMRQLHKSYLDRFLSDNQRIWTTAALFIPLSLAAFPALFGLKDASLKHSVVFAAVSILLITFWLFIAEKHRTFQSRCLFMVHAIEEYVIGVDRARAMRTIIHTQEPGGISVRFVRWALMWSIVAGWAVVIFLFGLGVL